MLPLTQIWLFYWLNMKLHLALKILHFTAAASQGGYRELASTSRSQSYQKSISMGFITDSAMDILLAQYGITLGFKNTAFHISYILSLTYK